MPATGIPIRVPVFSGIYSHTRNRNRALNDYFSSQWLKLYLSDEIYLLTITTSNDVVAHVTRSIN